MERIRALQGLRALALGMIVAYHIDGVAVPAGWWGVVVFFVLSGYLITRMLTAEADESGTIDLRGFYLKRAVRLYPALLVVCAVLVVVGTDWSTISASLGQYSNYARIAGADLGLLTHTWFLAVMAHFYLLWPLAIAAIPARYRVLVIGLFALVAIAWRVLAIDIASPGWVYNATDTNAAALLVGCFLGVTRPTAWRSAGWAVPVMLALMFVPAFGDEGSAVLWGGFVALALGVFAVQYALTQPRWLETRPMIWLGRVSYGLYLWHYVFLRSGMEAWIAIPLAVGTAAISWYFLEKPVLRMFSRFEDKRQQHEVAEDEATPELAAAS